MLKKRQVCLYLACLEIINCGLQCLNQVEMALRRILLSVLLSLPSCLEISLFPTPRWENTYILKINVVLDLMINTHLGSNLRWRISMSLSLAPTFSYHSRGGESLHHGLSWSSLLHLGLLPEITSCWQCGRVTLLSPLGAK